MKNKLINALKSKRGSAIVWAFGVSMVLLIVLEGVLLASKSYASRSIYNNSQQQAYMTARSAADMVAKQFTEYSTVDDLVAINAMAEKIYDFTGHKQNLGTVDFGDEMGECTITITMEAKKKMRISATAPSDKGDVTVTAVLRGGVEPKIDSSDVVSSMIIDDSTGKPLVMWFVVEYDYG